MRFKTDRCAHCGGPPRTFHSRLGLSIEGKISTWDKYFFCSDECFSLELNNYIPLEFVVGDRGKTIGDDPHYKFLIKDYKDARQRCYPEDRLYSNQEIAERDEFDRDERRLITQYENDWASKRSNAITNAVRQVNETWFAHHRQEWQQQEEEKRLEEERLRAVFRDFSDAILPLETRFSGHWIVAPPGRGKTTLLHSMFLEDIRRQASIIVMDSKGDLINPIKELKAVENRLVLIEPDAQFPLALNPLDVQSANIPHAIALIEYILSGLLDAKFTNLQSALFRHVLPAILQAIPSPTIETLKLVLANGLSPEQTANLDERLRQFFADKTNGFYSKTYAETRSQIIWRLDFILTNDTMRTMFASPTTRLKVADAMNSGKIIIIDASKAILGDGGSEFYQRFFLALILGAAQARSALNPAQKLPVYCYLDECQWVRNDQKLATILDECRSQKIALILAHQRTEQITNPNVLSAMSNCAIRFANSDDEAKFLAPKLRCDPEFLYSLPRGTFAAYIRDYTTTALALKIPYHDMRSLPRMTAAEQAALRDKMRAQYSNPKVRPAAPLEPQRSEPVYQRLFDENCKRVSAPPEAPQPAAAAPIPMPVAPPPVADTHLDAGTDTEAGKDW